MRCPNCGSSLIRTAGDRGIFFSCEGCKGRSVGVALLRRTVERSFVNDIWSRSESAPGSGRDCPSCSNEMRAVDVTPTETLDVCKPCQLVWFDPSAFELAPATGPAPSGPAIPQGHLETIARHQARYIAGRWRNLPDAEIIPPGSLAALPAAMGMPAEEEAGWLRRHPWVTWAVAATIAMIALLTFFDDRLVAELGLIPAETFRLGGLTFVTSFFVTPGVLQGIASVYFLVVFGDNVEDFLGSVNYALLLLVATLVGGILHAFFASDETAPLVGAGAGIAGVLVFYGSRFPQRRLRYFRLNRWFSMPASTAAVLWVLAQAAGGRHLWGTESYTSLPSLIGGSVVGLWFWWLWRNE